MTFAILNIIPPKFRRRGIWVAFTIFLRAVLNFAGLAMMLPVLFLILDTDGMTSNPYMRKAFELSGTDNPQLFAVMVCAAVTAVIIIKCAANLMLYRAERDYTYELYRYMSRRLYIDYHNRGLQFIKGSSSAVLARNVNVVCLTFVAGILRPAAGIVSEATLFALLFAALTAYDWVASLLVALIFIPAVWIYTGTVRRRLAEYGQAENKEQRAKARNVIDTFRGYADIEINNAFPEMLAKFDASMERIVGMRVRNATIAALPQIFTEVALVMGMSALVMINLGMEGDRMRILFGIFAVAALRIMPSIRNIMSSWASLRYNKYTLQIIRDADIDKADTSVESSEERFHFSSMMQVENLSFRFDGDERNVIDGMSFTIGKGERVGIRGRSGSGKTTLFNLLLGFYRPTGGMIYIDGEPLSKLSLRKWQNTIGYVSQNVFLTDGSFKENIALGTPAEKIDRQRLDRAIDMAELREFIDSLPEGVDTIAGECGSRLSGGQRQRIGIARALYKQADILFFDEATSSLDNDTEHNINEAIERLSRENTELTIVIIAHRESSLDWCDRIINIDEL